MEWELADTQFAPLTRWTRLAGRHTQCRVLAHRAIAARENSSFWDDNFEQAVLLVMFDGCAAFVWGEVGTRRVPFRQRLSAHLHGVPESRSKSAVPAAHVLQPVAAGAAKVPYGQAKQLAAAPPLLYRPASQWSQ